MILYDYFRSSAAYRVRIALNLKGLAYEHRPINLVKREQHSEGYQDLQPQGLVPALVLDNGQVLTQSLAICEYLDEVAPAPALLPSEPIARARVRALAQTIACDIHPVNNLRVLQYLTGTLDITEDAKLDWYRHWVALGFAALETQLQHTATGTYCHGDTPTLADVCLIPQVFNARRFNCELSAYPKLVQIAERCEALPAFAQAHPAQQPDAK
jgi:maleylacetoacetate isomerase